MRGAELPSPSGRGRPARAGGPLVTFVTWAILVPFCLWVACCVAMLLLQAVNAHSPAREGYRTVGGQYFVLVGKPARPREVSAAYWWVNYALETAAGGGLIAMLVLAAFAQVAEWLAPPWLRRRAGRAGADGSESPAPAEGL